MLSGKQRRHLRGLGHHLDAVVQVGKDGLTEGIVSALDVALEQHELIKVRLLESVGGDRHGVAAGLAEAGNAELVQVLGRTLLLYRARKQDPKIKIPAAP
jgi:RNA-binding protein